MSFVELASDRGFYSAMPTTHVIFDAAIRNTRFKGKCVHCGQYDEVIGADPIVLVEGTVIPPKSFVRTDIEFGTHDEKCPLILCGIEAGRMLQRKRFAGLTLDPVWSQ